MYTTTVFSWHVLPTVHSPCSVYCVKHRVCHVYIVLLCLSFVQCSGLCCMCHLYSVRTVPYVSSVQYVVLYVSSVQCGMLYVICTLRCTACVICTVSILCRMSHLCSVLYSVCLLCSVLCRVCHLCSVVYCECHLYIVLCLMCHLCSVHAVPFMSSVQCGVHCVSSMQCSVHCVSLSRSSSLDGVGLSLCRPTSDVISVREARALDRDLVVRSSADPGQWKFLCIEGRLIISDTVDRSGKDIIPAVLDM